MFLFSYINTFLNQLGISIFNFNINCLTGNDVVPPSITISSNNVVLSP